jgi:hypothetical protein
MRHEARFDFRLAAVQRQELAALADATGLTSTDLVRLGIRWLLDRQEVLLRPDCLNQQPSHCEHAASACDGENMSTNYYLGPQRGGPLNVNRVVAGTSTAGSSVDLEARLQIVNGATPTGLTRKDSIMLLKIIEAFIDGGGNNHDGQNLPAL